MDILFGNYPIKIQSKDNKDYIFDIIRKKWLVLTLEEQVRQVWLNYLVLELKISESRISVERGLKINGKIKRFDICVFDEKLSPHILIECKAPNIKLSLPSMEQLSIYNIALQTKVFILTNGVTHYGYKISSSTSIHQLKSTDELFL